MNQEQLQKGLQGLHEAQGLRDRYSGIRVEIQYAAPPRKDNDYLLQAQRGMIQSSPLPSREYGRRSLLSLLNNGDIKIRDDKTDLSYIPITRSLSSYQPNHLIVSSDTPLFSYKKNLSFDYSRPTI
jgi:hypothetical protein